MKRNDRWFALLALLYVTSDELSRSYTDTSEWGRWYRDLAQQVQGNRKGRISGRTITANLLSLQPNTISNALADAANRGLFTRQRHQIPKLAKARPRNRPGGRLTERGWNALGPVPEEWRKKFGPTWRYEANPVGEVATGENARTALNIIAGELIAEELEASSLRSSGPSRS